jgi:hypothetical protein
VSFATENGTAVAPGDYEHTAATLTFEPSSRSSQTRSVVVRVFGDGAPEGDETFSGRLYNAIGGTIVGGPGRGIVRNKAKSDANGDGRSDIVVLHIQVDPCEVGLVPERHYNGHIVWGHGEEGIDPGGVPDLEFRKGQEFGSDIWQVAATGDFNGDGVPDLVWQQLPPECAGATPQPEAINVTMSPRPEPGSPVVYRDPSGLGVLLPAGDWIVVGSADFGGIAGDHGDELAPPDGKADLLWHNTVSGELGIWLSDGQEGQTFPEIHRHVIPGAGVATVPLAVADLDGDVAPEIVFRDSRSGTLSYWKMNGLSHVGGGELTPDHTGNSNWRIVGAGDFNGDGFDDLLFSNDDSHELVGWLMAAAEGEGPTRLTGGFVAPQWLEEKIGNWPLTRFQIGGPR